MTNKIINNCERYLHHLNFVFTFVVSAAIIFYVSLNMFKAGMGTIEICLLLLSITGMAIWTALLAKLSMELEAKHKAQLKGDSDEK